MDEAEIVTAHVELLYIPIYRLFPETTAVGHSSSFIHFGTPNDPCDNTSALSSYQSKKTSPFHLL